MEQIELNVTKREAGGKSLARQLRREGLVPAIIYGKGYDAQPVSVNARELQRLFAEGVHGTSLLRLHIDGKATRNSPLVMIKEVQRNPITGQLLNVDFHKISLTEKVTAQVPIVLTGESPAIRLGGILEQTLREVEVECLPTEIPDHIEIDTSGLEIGHTIHVSDLSLPDAVTLMTGLEDVVAVMAAPKAVEEPVPAVEGVEAAAGEEEEIKEPEVLAQKREREEEAEEAEPERGKGRQKER
jgi:large subunit ribosomal protein L25